MVDPIDDCDPVRIDNLPQGAVTAELVASPDDDTDIGTFQRRKRQHPRGRCDQNGGIGLSDEKVRRHPGPEGIADDNGLCSRLPEGNVQIVDLAPTIVVIPSLQPVPRKLNRKVENPASRAASRAAMTTLLCILPPYRGWGWVITAHRAPLPS